MTARLMLGFATLAICSAAAAAETDKTPEYRSPIRFMPSKRAVGDVMPFYWKGEYHVFYLTNPTGNEDVNWEHTVSKDLVTWKELPPALTPDKSTPTGPEGGCMFTGCIVEKDGVFHAWYTSWNPNNPAGREYLSHATSKDLIQWTKHPEHMIAPDGIHYANHHDRDFRDPHVFWNEQAKEYWMHIVGNVPGQGDRRFGVLTSKDLVRWQQQKVVEGVPGDECPDHFQIGDTHYIHSCQSLYCYSDKVEGRYKYPALTRELDAPFMHAGKLLWDGKRHVLFAGWVAGPMPSPREVYGGPNGLLYIKPVPEILNLFKHTALDLAAKPEFTQSGSAWRYDGPVLRSGAGPEPAKAVFSVPENYLLDCLVTMTPKSRLTLTIAGQYRLCLTPENGQLSLTGPESNRTRPCPVDISKPVKIQVFAEGKLIECFVNDQFAQTCMIGSSWPPPFEPAPRRPLIKENQLGIASEGGSVGILKLQVKTCQ